MKRAFVGLLAAWIGAVLGNSPGLSQTPRARAETAQAKAKSEDAPKQAEDKEPPPSVTEHTVTINGHAVKYRATAGYYYMKDYSPAQGGGGAEREAHAPAAGSPAAGKPDAEPPTKAKIFYIAYTREGAEDAARRPITFAFNGGPGSSSVWLHMGALGPRRAHLTDRGEAPPPPYQLEDNSYSWLDDTDLVFIDPMSTGFSRPGPGVRAQQFYGYEQDLASVGDFIRLYTTRNQRWGSPKFIAGESYGTTRAAGLSDYLENRYSMYVNGIILISSVLNFQNLSFSPGNDAAYPLFMPTYAAAAWYHRKLAPELEAKPLAVVLQQAEVFASHDYLLALMRGDTLAPEEKAQIAGRLSRLIGLPETYIAQLNLRVSANLFFAALLKDDNRSIGRYDSRFKGIRANPGTDQVEFDPSYEAVAPTFAGVFNDYIRRELKYESDLPYETLAAVQPWLLQENGYLDVAVALRDAMNRHPYLKVWVCCGYYDLATPYFSAKTTMNRMLLDPAIRANLTLTYYESGHMVYINKPSLVQLKADFETFLSGAVMPESQAVPTAAP